MLRVIPFAGLRPVDDLVSMVAASSAVKQDREAVEALLRENPYSILHVERAEADLAPGATEAEVDAQAKEAFSIFREHEILVQDEVPCVYFYQLQHGEHIRTGVVMGCAFENMQRGVLKAEARAAAMDMEQVLRLQRLHRVIGAQLRPVTLLYHDMPEVDALVTEVIMGAPLYDFTTQVDGVTHRVWRLPGMQLGEFFVNAFARAEGGVVVDGYEELEALLRGRREMGARADEAGAFLALLLPASQMGVALSNGVGRNGERRELSICSGLLGKLLGAQ